MIRQLTTQATAYLTINSHINYAYFFLNDFFDRQYQSDQRFGKVFGLFTILTIIVPAWDY